ncbi:MFS transporter [Streptomyces sp. NPDC001020]
MPPADGLDDVHAGQDSRPQAWTGPAPQEARRRRGGQGPQQRAANTCGGGASGTPSWRRPTAGPPACAKAHGADGPLLRRGAVQETQHHRPDRSEARRGRLQVVLRRGDPTEAREDLRLLPVGGLVVVLSPVTGRLVGAHGPRLPLAVAGGALALGGAASLWLGPATPLPAALAVYLLFGLFLSTVNPPITNTAVSGMPRSMAGVAASLASASRQTGTTLGVAISGAIVGSVLPRDGTAFTRAERGVWWMVLTLGLSIVVLGLLSTGRRAMHTAARAAALFDEVDQGAELRTVLTSRQS